MPPKAVHGLRHASQLIASMTAIPRELKKRMEQRLALWSKMMHVTRHALSDVSHIGISGILSAVRVLEAHNQDQELWTPPADQVRPVAALSST